VLYRVSDDGTLVGQTTGTSLRPPAPLTEGPHSWQVTAVNLGGIATVAQPATIHIDTLAPIVSAALSGRRVVGSAVHLQVAITDLRPGEPAAGSSGILSRAVRWGDGTTTAIARGKYHVYHRAGLYRITVTVADRAGNVTTVARYIRIRPAPAKHRRARGSKGR
jgi:PKD repeat protein